MKPKPRWICTALVTIFACASYDKKDENQLTVADYSAAIQKTPGNHELYFRRGALYFAQYYESHDVFNLALSDYNKAIELAGKKPPLEYFAKRAFALASRGLDNTIWPKNWGHYLNVKNTFSADDLKNAILDYDKIIAFTEKPLKLLNYYQQRGQLHYYLEKFEPAANDFEIVERLQRAQDMGTVEESYQVWQALDYTYEQLAKEPGSTKKWTDCKTNSAAKLSFWRNASIKDYEAAQARKRERDAKASREHAEQCVAKAKAAKTHKQTCGHCKGSGTVVNYSAGTGNYQSSASIENGKMKWMEKKGQDSSWSHGNCPVCLGRGYTLPPIEGCDPRYLE
ncbi:MAG: hypothetical protein KF713_00340 [Turneriella sp.]|nr:hypothetical protein [Turneriella sp.]